MNSKISAKPTILFFHPNFQDGGVERTNIEHSKLLIADGYDVRFITTNPKGSFAQEALDAGISFVTFKTTRTAFIIPRLISYVYRATKSSVLLISCQYYVNLLTILGSAFLPRRVTIVVFERNHLSEFGYKPGPKSTVIRVGIRLLYRFADAVLANSQQTARDLASYATVRVRTVYNPTINDRFLELAAGNVETGLSLPQSFIVGCGRLSVQKDFGTLIRAHAIVQEKLSDLKLLIVGGGTLLRVLMNLVEELGTSDSVIFTGFLPNPYPIIRRSKLFVLSSLYEGLPNVLIEAVACGVPVVSTECKSGPSEILYGGAGGDLVPLQDAGAMAESILKNLTDREYAKDRHKIAADGLERFTRRSANRQLRAALHL